jgi:hypothetical protein
MMAVYSVDLVDEFHEVHEVHEVHKVHAVDLRMGICYTERTTSAGNGG